MFGISAKLFEQVAVQWATNATPEQLAALFDQWESKFTDAQFKAVADRVHAHELRRGSRTRTHVLQDAVRLIT